MILTHATPLASKEGNFLDKQEIASRCLHQDIPAPLQFPHATQRLKRNTQDNEHSLLSAVSAFSSPTIQEPISLPPQAQEHRSPADNFPAVYTVGNLHATIQSSMEVPRGSHRRFGLQVLPAAKQPFSGQDLLNYSHVRLLFHETPTKVNLRTFFVPPRTLPQLKQFCVDTFAQRESRAVLPN